MTLTFEDQGPFGGGSMIGTIIGVVIGVSVVFGSVVIGLIFLNKRQKMREVSDPTSSDGKIQYLPDTLMITTDETLASSHESVTYEGGPSLINTIISPTLPGNDRDITTLPLI
jgi:ABC-type antimicrobial peptide transport system permease subunit